MLLALLGFCSLSLTATAGPGDTLVVQTFTYGSPQNQQWFQFPSDTLHVRKILMQYTLKCNPANTPYACGEWDYLTYTYLYQHTHTFDSTLLNHANYEVNGATPDSFQYVTNPTYHYSSSWQYSTNYGNTTSLNTYTTGNASATTNQGFQSAQPVSRTQLLWHASELMTAGMSAGNITGLDFYLQSAGSSLHHLTLRMKNSTLDSLSASSYENSGLLTVYSANTTLQNGWDSLALTTPFAWDGISNILIEICYDNTSAGTDNLLYGSNTGFQSVLSSSGADRVAQFDGNDHVIVPASAFAPIDSFITVSYWAYGDPVQQPMNGTCFEGVDAANNRVINAHCPWGDGTVYWDAGNSGTSSYDRISQAATQAQYEGNWHYWTFTKNAATGAQIIYLDGNVFKTGSGLYRTMSGIHHFQIAQGNWAGSESYEGSMDEFSVWNIDLPQAQIQANMHQDITPANPYYSHLAAYYQFNDGTYSNAANAAPGGAPGTYINTANPFLPAQQLFRNFVASQVRPDIRFEQRVFNGGLDSVQVTDSTEDTPVDLILYSDFAHPAVATDTQLVWNLSYNHYHFNANNQAIDSSLILPFSTIYKSVHNYYSAPFEVVNQYELARYITPYGINLTQLNTPWTWTYDVSDYRTLLKDSVQLSAGNWQELLDVKFLFIKGIAPRDPLNVQNLWNGVFYYGSNPNQLENGLPAKTVSIANNVSGARVKLRITGHGEDANNCDEFCQKTHYLLVNNTQRWSQLVWRSTCPINPLQPQGGTWVYERANWCPGAEVETYDFELTPYITAGDTVNLNHNADPYVSSGGADYVIEDQLVTYGPAHFSLDAAVDMIKSPSTDQMWGHASTVCTSPVIVIQNTGSTTLTSLDITYGLGNSTPGVFHWTGNLKFMEKQEVALSYFNYSDTSHDFYVTVGNPNGGQDQYAANNTAHSVFNAPPAFPNQVVLVLKSNAAPAEDNLILKDTWGNVLFNFTPNLSNHVYRDTLNLPSGCYELVLNDAGEDGLSFWANSGQGSGYFQIRRGDNNAILKNYNADFGAQIYQQFSVGMYTNVNELQPISANDFQVYPNPSSGLFQVGFVLKQTEPVTLNVVNLNGTLVKQQQLAPTNGDNVIFDLSGEPAGMYFVTLKTADWTVTRKVMLGH